MKVLTDTGGALAAGLAEIRRQFKLPTEFPAEVVSAAEEAASRTPSAHRDRTSEPFVTLDPATSTDLDQAFHITADGDALVLHYAIADVAWFVDDGGVVDQEAWRRGTTQYLPDGRVPLYPPVLSEQGASLLPDGPRPAVVFEVAVDANGQATLRAAERAVVHSRAKLAYATVTDHDLPPAFGEFYRRVADAEAARGAARVDPAEQQVVRTPTGFELSFAPRLPSEDHNAALSLATNLAVAAALFDAGTGLFRVMPAPDERSVKRLRHTARAFGLSWPADQSLADFERGLSPDRAPEQAMMLAIRRSGGHASYAAFEPGQRPWHAAVAATYAHATAPLRRLADRYVIRAAMSVMHGEPVEQVVTDAFGRLGEVMGDADALAAQLDRAVVDLAEAVTLEPHVGDQMDAVVTDIDERGARIQLSEYPVVARVAAHRVQPGDEIEVRLEAVDVATRSVTFRRVG